MSQDDATSVEWFVINRQICDECHTNAADFLMRVGRYVSYKLCSDCVEHYKLRRKRESRQFLEDTQNSMLVATVESALAEELSGLRDVVLRFSYANAAIINK